MKIRMSGDICHTGVIELEVESLAEAVKLLNGGGFSEDEGFQVYDEQDCLWFIPDGNIYDEAGNEIVLSDE